METLSQPRVIPVAQMTAPCLTLDVDVASGVPSIPPQLGGRAASCAWLLVRVHTEPIGSVVLRVPAQGLTEKQVAAGIVEGLGEEVSRRMGPETGVDAAEPAFLESRKAVLEKAPQFTVVVCTHERPEGLDLCLQSLLDQRYPNYGILVVDNAPDTDRARRIVERIDSPMITYVVESRKGLSWARNKALRVIDDGIVAWIDDDEVADPDWIAELARGFHDHPEADAVCGVMIPGELETDAQVWFEQYGGHNKLRGFTPAVFSPRSAHLQSPYYPLPQFGTGGNAAIRLDALARIGGFDVALGAGSRCMGAEDTRAFTDLLVTGGTVVYQPTAVTRHFHRRTVEELKRQMRGYGTGLTAFYASLIVTRPRCIPDLVRLLPSAWRDFFGSQSLRSGDLPEDFPNELRNANRRGLLLGPICYVRARWESTGRNHRPADPGGANRPHPIT
ncbi:MAG: glycosyltransferase [Acidimicrobiales bacterium]|jgi:glycosyltransferase involved in cell wall biosynthesis